VSVPSPEPPEDRIAIVGMACRVPGAPDLEAFWRNVVSGVESIETLSVDELRAAGVSESLIRDPQYVRAGGFVPGVDGFDAALFNCTPREASMLDPQHRLLMECAWNALEHAGHSCIDRSVRTGVYVGVANSTYTRDHVQPSLEPRDSSGAYQALIAGERDFLATRISYFFDLSGPSVNVQTACSTSLVAVHLACQALIAGECDMALAGAAAVRLPQRVGYQYEEGMILSHDGHCRPFDADASGTVVGNGAGIVVLRRLADAIADGDTVHAVILGSAVNNDGSQKLGYTAPGVEGQASVIREAQMLAGVSAESIGYLEAHGTGTSLGDSIEVLALTEAFRRSTTRRGFCALGSVKSNIGHLDTAAGVVGLIKAALALSRQMIPPCVHFRRANPALGLETTPFFVPSVARPWADGSPRRAGVSAFGIGGTNAHVVLEASEIAQPSSASRRWQLLCVSAKTEGAVRKIASALADHLANPPAPTLPDVAFTLAVGRRLHEHRSAIVCASGSEASERLGAVTSSAKAVSGRGMAWIFPGEEGVYPDMGRALSGQEPVFRAAVAEAMFALSEFPHASPADVALFAMEHGLVALWRDWGATPQAILGIGAGTYAAAVAAGMLTLGDAARLLAVRKRADLFGAELATMTIRPPSTGWVSSMTGTWLTDTAATNPDHWVSQLSQPPRTAAALQSLLEGSDRAVLTVGPGTVTMLAEHAGPHAILADSCGSGVDETHAIANAVATLWSAGVSVDWRQYYSLETRRREPLPQYPFERMRHWIDRPARTVVVAESAARSGEPAAYLPTWLRAPKLPHQRDFTGSWVIVGDVQGIATRLSARLKEGGATVATAGPDAPAWRAILRETGARHIVLLGASYESLVALGKVLASENIQDGVVSLLAVTEDLHRVTGEESFCAAASLALGPLRVLPQEHPEIICRNIDIVSCISSDVVDLLLAECAAPVAPAVVAIRGSHRWRLSVEKAETTPVSTPYSVDRPVYLIVGGLGLVGLALARHLHDAERARLVLVGRTPLLPLAASESDAADIVILDIDAKAIPEQDTRTARLHSLAELRHDGADLLCVTADVSDEHDLRRAFAAAEAAFGRVDVVVHAGGATRGETFTPFEELTPETARRHFRPKVDGVEALRNISREKPLRACVLMSSLSSVLGGLGFAAYAAANAYLDAVAQHDDGLNGVRWLSIGWDAWQSPEQADRPEIAGELMQHAIAASAGAALFSRLLASDTGAHVLVSTTDLVERFARASQPQTARIQTAVVPAIIKLPVASTEDVITSTWAELLGVDTVGPHDDFYDLGGNSLLATQVVSRLRRTFGIQLSVRAMFEENTVAGLARYVDTLSRSGSATAS
jgi:acyl transferase domain-containing protein/acyl carrier protein